VLFLKKRKKLILDFLKLNFTGIKQRSKMCFAKYSEMTIKQLKEECKKRGMTRYSKCSKEELISELLIVDKYENESENESKNESKNENEDVLSKSQRILLKSKTFWDENRKLTDFFTDNDFDFDVMVRLQKKYCEIINDFVENLINDGRVFSNPPNLNIVESKTLEVHLKKLGHEWFIEKLRKSAFS
jgi:hypothetical protein